MLCCQPGDQLISVNEFSVEQVSHAEAVRILSNSHNHEKLMVRFKRIGRIPFSPVNSDMRVSDQVLSSAKYHDLQPVDNDVVNMVSEKVKLISYSE